jgi:hypothetical protein
MNKTIEKDKRVSGWKIERTIYLWQICYRSKQTRKSNTQQQNKSIKRITTTPSTWNMEKISNSTSNKQQI